MTKTSFRKYCSAEMNEDEKQFLEVFADYLMPDLTPHESSMYVFLYRNSFLKDGSPTVRIGQRTLSQKYGRGPKMSVPSRAHITRQVDQLEKKGCIVIGDTNREGTLYRVIPPSAVPLVIEKLSTSKEDLAVDWYRDPEKRIELFERDGWTCRYCGEPVSEENATLDHFIPQHAGGEHTQENLHTACLLCNSIKSGKSYEEAAPLLLKNITERRIKQLKVEQDGRGVRPKRENQNE